MISDAQRAMMMHARALVNLIYEAAERGDQYAGIIAIRTLESLGDPDLINRVYNLRASELGYTALHVAVTKGHIPFVKMMLENGSNINHGKMSSLVTPLHIAVFENNHEMIKFLLSYGHTNINATDQGGWTPLHWASKLLFRHTAELLIELGADDGYLTITGHTAAQLANEY